MPVNSSPIFPVSPITGIATLTTATAVTSRANISGTTGLVKLTDTSTYGTRIDQITVKSKATSVAANVFIWLYNGTTAHLFDEINITAVTAGNTSDSFTVSKSYNNLVLPPTYQLYISETVQTDLTVFAFGGVY